MTKTTLLMFTITYCAFAQLTNKLYLEEYCWRDFEGIVPEDAFSAGTNRAGREVYIGQTLFGDKLIPGQIYKNDNNIYFELNNKEVMSKENIKILCSHSANKFKWIQTNKDKIGLLVGQILIKGGFEPSYYTYIGRVQVNSSVNVGKVVCRGSSCLSMFTTENGVAKTYDDFHILSFNSSENFSGTVIYK